MHPVGRTYDVAAVSCLNRRLPRLTLLRWRRAGWVLAAALLGGCAGTMPPAGALPGLQGAERSGGTAQRLAPGVYMVRGSGGEPGPDNLGRTGNAGFIVGPTGVLVIDTGVSFRHGQALLAEIARVTPLPVRQVVVTHTRQEFLFGAGAFRARGIPVLMHRQAAALMAARCEGCLKTLQRVLGDEEMRGTTLFTPDVLVDAGQVVDLIGRPVQLLYEGHSSGPGDLAVFDPASGVLFAGGLLDQGYIPDVQDSDLAAWSAALVRWQGLPLRQVVPGHGPASSPALIGDVARYLAQLQRRAAELLARGAALSEVADLTELPDFRGWDQYETIHRRNASVVYLRLERELLFK